MAEVVALGRTSWSEAAAGLTEATCVWQDLGGLHCGPVPQEPPLTTHLWAWTPEMAWRYRIDGDFCIGGRINHEGLAAMPISPRSTPNVELARLLAEVTQDVGMLIVGGPSQVVFLVPV